MRWTQVIAYYLFLFVNLWPIVPRVEEIIVPFVSSVGTFFFLIGTVVLECILVGVIASRSNTTWDYGKMIVVATTWTTNVPKGKRARKVRIMHWPLVRAVIQMIVLTGNAFHCFRTPCDLGNWNSFSERPGRWTSLEEPGCAALSLYALLQ